MPRQQTIYLVDDEPAVRRSLERLLKSAGYEVLSFESPRTFLAAAPGLREGCVLLDVRMPELSGLDVLDRLRQSGVALGVVMMTAHGDVSTAVNALKASISSRSRSTTTNCFSPSMTRSPRLRRQIRRARQRRQRAASPNWLHANMRCFRRSPPG